jgi:hypothetical protein
MKKIYAIIAIACAPFCVGAQCTIQVSTVNVSCNNGCDGQATAQMTGTGPFTYMWMPVWQNTPTITNLCEGMYQVDGTDATGCTATATINITQPPIMNVVFLSNAASCQSCCNGTINLTVAGGTPPYSYAWTPNVGNGPNVQNLCPGTYSCCVTDANGCTSCNSYPVNFNTGINDVTADKSLDIFPSVASDLINVKGTFAGTGTAQLTVLNIFGEVVFSKSCNGITAFDEKIDISQYKAGMYFISVTTATGTAVRRFVKE